MPYQHIAYVSCATKPLSSQELDVLLLDARNFNHKVDVTGVLLCHHKTFFQFIEGTPEAINEVYKRIKASKKHHTIFELVNEVTKDRYFSDWSMGYCFVPKTEMQELLQAQWESQLPLITRYAEKSLGIKMLQEFWNHLALDSFGNKAF